MIAISAFTVFVLGLRHGADPDHLAAIDNMTRNSLARSKLSSRFVGTLFAAGHSVMVLAIAALVGLCGSHFRAQHAFIENVGTVISIIVLLIIAGLNAWQLRDRNAAQLIGAKNRLLPAVLKNATNPLVALLVGFLFGFGFETSSQIAAYALAFGSAGGLTGAVIVGGVFSLGMIVTDTLDSLIVHRLVKVSGPRLDRAKSAVRVWIMTVTAMAIAVAAYETAQLCGWQSPFPDIAFSGVLMGVLFLIFSYLFVSTRSAAEQTVYLTTISS